LFSIFFANIGSITCVEPVLKLHFAFHFYSRDDAGNEISSWHVYITGHSLGGALATLFAVELSSKLAKSGGQTQITMYNFGSPRVGNKQFADMYNEVGEIFLDFFPVLYHLNYTTFLKH
jgi:hypothetical protein